MSMSAKLRMAISLRIAFFSMPTMRPCSPISPSFLYVRISLLKCQLTRCLTSTANTTTCVPWPVCLLLSSAVDRARQPPPMGVPSVRLVTGCHKRALPFLHQSHYLSRPRSTVCSMLNLSQALQVSRIFWQPYRYLSQLLLVKITGILPDVSVEVSRSVSQGLQEGMETQRPAFPPRPTISTPPPLSRTKTPDQSTHMTRPLSSDRPLASNRQISRILESQPPLQAKKAFPGAASTRTPVTPLPIPPLGANSEPEANHAQATQKLQSSDEQTAKLVPPAQSEPKDTLTPAGNRRSVFVLGTSVVVLACICVVTLIYSFQRPGTSTHIPLQALATAGQQQTDTSTTPGFFPTSKATSSSGSGGVQNTLQTHVTPKPGQTPSTQANNTPTTGQPATNPTTVPTQAPAPKAFYSFEGSAQGWSGESCDVQVSSQYAYAGANSLEAKNIASYSYAYVYGATISQGETIIFYVYVPAGSSSVSADVSIGNDANNWDDGPKTTLIPGQWNRVSHTLAKSIPGNLKIGIDMYANGTANVYIDAVSWG